MDVSTTLQTLQNYIEAEQFAGHDPYDALNSPILSALCFRNKFSRIVFIQLLKRLPLNLRRLFFIKKGYNPKGLGLFLWGYAKLYDVTRDPGYLSQIEKLLALLQGLKSSGCSGNGWGYNFDWQSRAFFVPKYTPTIVNSAFIGHALLDTWKITGNKLALDMALPIRDFILRDLNQHREGRALCFSYTSLDHYFVHNANLLGASLLIRIHEQTGDKECLDMGLRALNWSMGHQRPDGSWPYAEVKSAGWIDSFHTGFNLQSIRYFLKAGFAKEWREKYEKGVRFYAKHFFLNDGTPKYYHDRIWPVDIHSPAQAVVFFSGMGPEYQTLTETILRWMIEHLKASEGVFYFQKFPFYTNKIPYIRWGQAWAFHALTEHRLYYEQYLEKNS